MPFETYVLMLRFQDHPTPFAYQVSYETYQEFSHLESITNLQNKPSVLRQIERFEKAVLQKRLQTQIEEWEARTKSEIAIAQRVEDSRENLKGLFQNL